MSIQSTLARAGAELRAGESGQARRRIRGLVSSYPDDLTVRHRLAEAYRESMLLDEAGRWNYLDETFDLAELDGFERRYHTPARRLAALRWPDPASNPPATPIARRRLAALYREATGLAPTWPDHPEDAQTTRSPVPLPTRPRPPRPLAARPVPLRKHLPPPPTEPVSMAVGAFRLTLLLAASVLLIALVYR
ncbi:DUF6584 family protein [Kitasatospora sp. NPDC049285]|uniref:DUF6584 family protein n=1 Tax=Kitasatospora sp. NPDC049285 TaxID=3157096 RepID=UPI00341FAAD7